MKILICNERFLFRFGVDRVLMILGKYFRDMGHEVVMIGNKLDEVAVEKCTDHFIKLPESPEYIDSNEYTLQWLEKNWDICFDDSSEPDIALIAGWPFYKSIKFLKDKCGTAIFHDYGAVPVDNMEGGALIIQEKLRKLRKDNLSYADEIVAISRFLEETQSKPDSNNMIPTSTILLGCDHMELGLWTNKNIGLKRSKVVSEVENLKENGYRLIFLLGRFENGNYKNSQSSFNILREIKLENEKVKMLILAKEDDISIPIDLKESIKLLGFVSDEDLQDLMGISDVGISMSLWEGFNLPLAEMQLLKKPVFVFNKGAHPEVVINNYYLCESEDEMIKKIKLSFENRNEIEIQNKENDYLKFREFFTWRRCAVEFIEKFVEIKNNNKIVLIDVTNASHDTANSGVMRVTRNISRSLQNKVETIFVLWDSSIGEYVFPYDEEIKLLSSYGGPNKDKIIYRSKEGQKRLRLQDIFENIRYKNCIMLITETINEIEAKKIRRYLKSRKIKIAAIFYDAIPVLHPEFCNEEVLKNHKNYMEGLSECDVVIPISETSGEDLEKFWNENNISSTKIKTNLLAGELEGIKRTKKYQECNTSEKINILCVSTLEPRKNHKKLLNACIALSEKYPELDWKLDLVGNRYAGNDDIPNFVEKISKKNTRVKWLGVVDDEQLIRLYKEASFTVYPSIIEGYGMPIIESLWNGKACICSENGVMSELAKEGGCYTIDITDEKKIMEAIYKLSTDLEFRKNLEQQAISRNIRTWQDYTLKLLDIIDSISRKDEVINENKIIDPLNDLLFGGEKKLTSNLSFSEHFALASVLKELAPECSISIGKRECLDILSYYSDVVFSIESDKKTDIKYNNLKNVTYLSGSYSKVMSIIIDELNKADIAINFMFINIEKKTDTESIMEILSPLRYYNCKKPMFIVISNSCNELIREDLNSVKWQDFNNLEWINLEFINGVIKYEEEKINLCGGLALAYFSNKK